MASITIRNLDERTKSRLRLRAAQHSRSMEDEARTILRTALEQDTANPRDLASAIGDRFKKLGGAEIPVVPRSEDRAPPRPGK
jgi:plasmid stability protein